jgi:hypothetical protein
VWFALDNKDQRASFVFIHRIGVTAGPANGV